MLTGRCRELICDVVRPGGRPPVIDLSRSVALVVYLMRRNPVQVVAGAVFGVSQATVSRRWDLLRPIITEAVAGFIPDPREVLGTGTALVDGTLAPTWDWKHIPDLEVYSKAFFVDRGGKRFEESYPQIHRFAVN
jgi:hypothetical protein